jgi:hypothetical protein
MNLLIQEKCKLMETSQLLVLITKIGISFPNYRKKKRLSSSCCRICLCEDNEMTNPLINPCKCSGSMFETMVKGIYIQVKFQNKYQREQTHDDLLIPFNRV